MKQTRLNLCFFGEGAAEGADQAAADTADRAGTGAQATETTGAGKNAGGDGGKASTADGPQAEKPEQSAKQPEPAEPSEKSDEAYFREALSKAALAARIKAAEAAAARWEKEAEDLKQIYPFFSLEQSMRSDRGFVSLLKAGVSVRLAFEAANLEKILGAAMRYAAGTAGKRTVQSILAGASRVRENPVLDRAASVRKKDVGSLTDREIMKILQQVSNGERVTF